MPQLDSIVYLPHFRVEQASGGREVRLRVSYDDSVRCPECGGSRLKSKGPYCRTVRHTSIGQRASYLQISARQYKCLACRRVFRQQFDGILPYQRATEAFKEEVVQKHHQGIPQSVLEKMVGLGHATIERWYHYIQQRWVAEIRNNPAPLEMGIDEHWFTKKDKFATSLGNLRSHRIHDIIKGRDESSINAYLSTMPGKEKTTLVSMDMSESFRQIVQKNFPNAKIVTDRFHVIRLINRQFAKAYKQIEPRVIKDRGVRLLLRYHQWNVPEDKKAALGQYLEEHPALKALYDFKQQLCKLLLIKHRTAKQCRKLIPQLLEKIQQLKDSPIKFLKRLGRTLENWNEEVARMWRFTKNNAILEGLHTKMELISRRAYGFKNFENYRLRVRALCG